MNAFQSLDQNDLQQIRTRVQQFVNERKWQKFHLPKNLLIALICEGGELSEIFQWRPDSSDDSYVFEISDLTHTAEEISDVFVYTLRLSEMCEIDLSHSINAILHSSLSKNENDKQQCQRCKEENAWECLDFDKLISNLDVQLDVEPSVRNYAVGIQIHLGHISEIFCSKVEGECGVGLTNWETKEINVLSNQLGHIIIKLFKITKQVRLNMKDILFSKIDKNEKKYPIHLSQGSSAKYTAYSDQLRAEVRQKQSQDFIVHPIVYLSCMFGILFGVALL